MELINLKRRMLGQMIALNCETVERFRNASIWKMFALFVGIVHYYCILNLILYVYMKAMWMMTCQGIYSVYVYDVVISFFSLFTEHYDIQTNISTLILCVFKANICQWMENMFKLTKHMALHCSPFTLVALFHVFSLSYILYFLSK